MADHAEKFVARWVRNSPYPGLLILAGLPGNGKTMTAKAIYRFCSRAAMHAYETGRWDKKVPSCAFFSWPVLTDHFKEGDYGVMRDCNETELVVLDDVGAEHDPSKNAADKLCQILSRREDMFTVITTNVLLEHWAAKFDARISDRFLRNSRVVDLSEVPSYNNQ